MMDENCGVFGIYSNKHCAQDIYYGIFKLQHRGQRYCGIATLDGDIRIITHKGYVRYTFTESELNDLDGNSGIGHVSLKERQPIVLFSALGKSAIAFSGTLTNRDELRQTLKKKGYSFQTETDIELLGNLICSKKSYVDGIKNLAQIVKGSYSIVLLTEKGIYAARDRHGLKPLILGKRKKDYAVASESRALDFLNFKIFRDVEPGEIVLLNKDGIHSAGKLNNSKTAFCAFEWAYFASVDSIIEGISVMKARENLGAKLSEKDTNMDADIVSSVPFSGIGCALGYHKQSGIRYDEVYLIDRFASRSYLPLTQEERDKEAHLKLSVIKNNVKGKKIVLCDDSIVRGTQIKHKVLELKKAGAKEVHVRIACPPLLAPCKYGLSTRSYNELVARNYSVEEIQKLIGADSLCYNTIDDFVDALGLTKKHLCLSCFTGKYF